MYLIITSILPLLLACGNCDIAVIAHACANLITAIHTVVIATVLELLVTRVRG